MTTGSATTRTDAPVDPAARAAGRAIALATVAAIAVAVSIAALVPALTTADETAHVDYAYQVWHGHLPVFADGLSFRPPFGVSPPVQWVSQHPPLFYLLLAPVVGPLIDAGHPLAAVLAGRVMTALLAGAVVLAVAWAARQILTARRSVLVAAASIVAACCPWLGRLGGAVYNDVLFTLTAALLVGATARVLRRGPSGAGFALLTVICAATIAVRAAGFVLVALALGVVATAQLMRSSAPRYRVLGVVAAGAVGVIAVAPTAWFWLRNLRLSGSVVGGDPTWAAEHLSRTTSTFREAALAGQTWTKLWALFSYSGLPVAVALVLLLAVPAGLGLVRAARALRAPRDARRGTDVLIAAYCAAQVVTVFIVQVQYAAGGGGRNTRYMMPVLVPVAVVIGLGLDPRRRTWPLAAWCGLVGVDFALWWHDTATSALPAGSARRFVDVALVAAVVATAAVAAAVVQLNRARLARPSETTGAMRAAARAAQP